MAQSQRQARISELLKEEIGLIIHDNLKDPRVGFTTVTGVEVSPDIKTAKVAVGVLGSGEEKTRTIRTLEKSKGFIQGEIARRLRMKNTPGLHFVLDESAENSIRISKILEKIRKDEEE